MVNVYVDCSICIALFTVLQRKPREASKLIDAAQVYIIKCDNVYILIPKILCNKYYVIVI